VLARLDVARELGVRGSLRHRQDRTVEEQWAPAARVRKYDEIWGEAAAAVGAQVEPLGYGCTRIHRGERTTTTWFHNVQLDDPVTLRVALDKRLSHQLLSGAGVPPLEHLEFSVCDLGPAHAAMEEAPGAHFVVKPAAGTSGGAGVICAVDSRADLARAALHAGGLSKKLLLERRVRGDEYRFLLLDGELLDVIRRRPPSVVGDGRSTVRGLIEAENARRAAGRGEAGPVALDVTLDCILTLDAQGLRLASVPAAGRVVQVRAAANANAPSDNTTVPRSEVGPRLLDQLRAAAASLGLRLAGLDVITPGLEDPLGGTSGGAIVEVNGTPGLAYHYLVAEPERATRVAVPILETLLS
jgi:D-alanine-D-alanine ligase-like ATP-grasp enzyme